MKKTVLVTAGGTREYIDAVRFIGNPSTGKMGYAIAKEFIKNNYDVILISAPSYLKVPKNLKKFISVVSALEMKKAVEENFEESDIIVSAAAVADYRPEKTFPFKIKKEKNELTIKLIRNPDILKELGNKKKDKILVGFAAETSNLIENAKKKLIEKNLDMIIANDINNKNIGFGSDKNKVTIITRDKIINLPVLSKQKISEKIVKMIMEMCTNKNKS